jgi:prepilin peptidase CpaA
VFHTVVSATLVVLLVVAAVWDIRSRRIPNVITMSGLVAGLALRLYLGPAVAVEGLLGVAVGFALALPFLAVGALGGGDAKLLMAIGAFMGPKDVLGAGLLIAVVGGMMGVVDAGRRGILLPVIFNCGNILKHWVTFGRRGYSRSLTSVGALAIPYGVAIATGALLWWFLGVQSL